MFRQEGHYHYNGRMPPSLIIMLILDLSLSISITYSQLLNKFGRREEQSKVALSQLFKVLGSNIVQNMDQFHIVNLERKKLEVFGKVRSGYYAHHRLLIKEIVRSILRLARMQCPGLIVEKNSATMRYQSSMISNLRVGLRMEVPQSLLLARSFLDSLTKHNSFADFLQLVQKYLPNRYQLYLLMRLVYNADRQVVGARVRSQRFKSRITKSNTMKCLHTSTFTTSSERSLVQDLLMELEDSFILGAKHSDNKILLVAIQMNNDIIQYQ